MVTLLETALSENILKKHTKNPLTHNEIKVSHKTAVIKAFRSTTNHPLSKALLPLSFVPSSASTATRKSYKFLPHILNLILELLLAVMSKIFRFW
jgi:hypothetical protein